MTQLEKGKKVLVDLGKKFKHVNVIATIEEHREIENCYIIIPISSLCNVGIINHMIENKYRMCVDANQIIEIY